MNDESLYFECPCCAAELEIDAAGDLHGTPATDEPVPHGMFRGLAGIRSVDATPDWRQKTYYFNSQQQAPVDRVEHIDTTPCSVEQALVSEAELDPDIEEALATDLSNRSIKTKQTTN